MLEHGFEVSYPNQFVYTEAGTDREYEVVGRETADALRKYLEHLKQKNRDEEHSQYIFQGTG